MDQLRTPCVHRGTPDVLPSIVNTTEGDVELCICRVCRRFWLERGGWLLSRREAKLVLRSWPFAEQLSGAPSR
jgi:Zn-finger nucleic acid-binding protein